MACLVVVLPLLLGLGMTSYYMDGQVIVSIEKQQLSKLEAATNNLAESLHKKESLERQKTLRIGRLSDIKAAVAGYTQWSPALDAVADNLSDALVLDPPGGLAGQRPPQGPVPERPGNEDRDQRSGAH